MKNKFFLISLVIVLIFVGAFWSLSKNFKNTESSSPISQAQSTNTSNSFQTTPVDSNLLIKPHSPTKGNISAKVTVVEF